MLLNVDTEKKRLAKAKYFSIHIEQKLTNNQMYGEPEVFGAGLAHVAS